MTGYSRKTGMTMTWLLQEVRSDSDRLLWEEVMGDSNMATQGDSDRLLRKKR